MNQETEEFLQEFHFFRSALGINARMNSAQALTANISAIPQLITVYRENEDSKEVRGKCLTERSYSAAKFLVSLRLMEGEREIVQRISQKPLRLVDAKKEKKPVFRGTPKMERIEVEKKESRKEPEVQQFEKGNNSKRQYVNKTEARPSASPVFTEIRIEDQGRQVQHGRGGSKKESLKEYFTPSQTVQSNAPNQIHTLFVRKSEQDQKPQRKKMETVRQVKQFSPQVIVSQLLTERNRRSEQRQELGSQSQSEDRQQSNINLVQFIGTKPLDTQETHLHISPFKDQNSNRGSFSHRRTQLSVSPQIVNIHEVLRVTRSSRSRDSDRQRHMIEFNSKVEEELRGIKEELRQIRNNQEQELSNSQLSHMQSRVTSKHTFNPKRQRQSEHFHQQPKVLKFDLSHNNSLTPKPTKQLLTMSREVNIRNDSRAVSTSRKNSSDDKLFSSRLSHEKKRGEKSLQNLEKSSRLSKPKGKQLLTTRIAKFT